MASAGQKRGTCGHIMALFHAHLNCTRCLEKGMGTDERVQNKDCELCNKFAIDQKKQLATPT